MTASIALTPTSGPPGTALSVRGVGFARKAVVGVYWDQALMRRVTCDPHGSFSVTFAVPATAAAGTHVVLAGAAAATFVVAATPAPPPPPPPIDSAGSLAASLGFTTLNTDVSDEFDGPAGAVPSTRWEAKRYTSGSGTYWDGLTPMALDGAGNLVITATKQATGQWFSGELSGLTAYQGARLLVARARVPAGAGSWSAPIWEVDFPYGALGIELDVCEQLGREPTAYNTTVHARSGNPQVSVYNDVGISLAADFHEYACAVYDDHADFYLDSRLVKTITKAQLGSWEFNTTPRCLLIDLDMGGWGGAIDPTLTNQRLLVDFIRVYQ